MFQFFVCKQKKKKDLNPRAERRPRELNKALKLPLISVSRNKQ
jgi:hypothetical protein